MNEVGIMTSMHPSSNLDKDVNKKPVLKNEF